MSSAAELKGYVFLEELGAGSFSTVRKVLNIKNKQNYACKIIPKTNIMDPGDQNRFQREINAMAFIRHENIVALYDFFWDKDNFYLITDLCSEGELYDHIVKAGSFDEPLSALIFKQIATAVSVCHGFGIAHRDLKPENVLVDKFPHVKVSDFGLCGYLTNHIMMQTFCGSPCFCSPECLCRVPYDGSLSDVWSLGVLLFFMVTGTHPWSTSNTSVMLHQILKGDFIVPDSASNDLKNLLQGMLQVNPQDRWTLDKVLQHPWFEQSAEILNTKYAWMNKIEKNENIRDLSLKALSKECERMGQVREAGIVSPFEDDHSSPTEEEVTEKSSKSALPQLTVKGSMLMKARNKKKLSSVGRAVAFSSGLKRKSKGAVGNNAFRALNYIVPTKGAADGIEL